MSGLIMLLCKSVFWWFFNTEMRPKYKEIILLSSSRAFLLSTPTMETVRLPGKKLKNTTKTKEAHAWWRHLPDSHKMVVWKMTSSSMSLLDQNPILLIACLTLTLMWFFRCIYSIFSYLESLRLLKIDQFFNKSFCTTTAKKSSF